MIFFLMIFIIIFIFIFYCKAFCFFTRHVYVQYILFVHMKKTSTLN